MSDAAGASAAVATTAPVPPPPRLGVHITPAPIFYPICVGEDAWTQLTTAVLSLRPSHIAVVSDSNVWASVGPLFAPVLSAWADAGLRHSAHILPPGEASKSTSTVARLHAAFSSLRVNRSGLVVSLGGGVIGDLAGFASSTYLRGVGHMLAPTSLLAAVDSSIGGKTGVDSEWGKNLIGAFHQPVGVYFNPAVLATLPTREVANGYAEVIKTAIVSGDSNLFDDLEQHAEEIVSTSCAWSTSTAAGRARVIAVLEACMAVKARVVSGDEKEGGFRSILNLGHTVGHGLEALFQPELLHGECVAIGTVVEVAAARAAGWTSTACLARITALFKSFRLPVTVPQPVRDGSRLEECIGFMLGDKKNSSSGSGSATSSDESVVIKAVMVRSVGVVATPPWTHPLPRATIERLMAASIVIHRHPTQHPVEVHTRVPGSKSLSNRALLLAALSRGSSRITGLLLSDDTQVMITAARALGAVVEVHEGEGEVDITGVGCVPTSPSSRDLYVHNAGTASRFLTALCAVLSGVGPATPLLLRGNKRMHERPIGPLVDTLTRAGARISYEGAAGCLPLKFHSSIPTPAPDHVCVPGTPCARTLVCASTLSSQYISALLMVCPLLPPVCPSDAGHVYVRIEEDAPVSLPYITMTVTIMRAYGVHTDTLSPSHYRVPRCGTYSPPTGGTYAVEADASSASYMAAVAAVTGSRVHIHGVGRSSSQGDAGFAHILARMGCEVQQTEECTTVKGPAVLTGCGTIDMSKETDTFLTLAAIATRAVGETRITGISNQRVKECDRITAMRVQLSSIGARVSEEGDDLIIHGREAGVEDTPPGDGGTLAHIHTYDDHRVAMSMAALAHAWDRPVMCIHDPDCVGKTYSEWWDACDRYFHSVMRGGHMTPTAPPGPVTSVVLLGMRGAGKSSLGRALAQSWGAAFIDTDDEIAVSAGMPLSDLIATRGWPAFRQLELQVLRRALAAARAGTATVIACGGGVVETAAACDALLQFKSCGSSLILTITRPVEHIVHDLNAAAEAGGHRPPYPDGASLLEVATRRAPLYLNCSHADFNIVDRDWTSTAARFTVRVMERIAVRHTPRPAAPTPTAGGFSSFLCIPVGDLPSLCSDSSALAAALEGVDAVELRLDSGPPFDLTRIRPLLQLQPCRPRIILTFRSKAEGGNLDCDDAAYAAAIQSSMRALDPDFIDVEVARMSAVQVQALCAHACAAGVRVIASSHDLNPPSVNLNAALSAAIRVHAHTLKLVAACTSTEHALAWRADAVRVVSRHDWFKSHTVAIAMGATSTLTRVLNVHMTPVTSQYLSSTAAGQMTRTAIAQARVALSITTPTSYVLLGSPVAASLSPVMHDAWFKYMQLPHRYSVVEAATPDALRDFISSRASSRLEPRFGGANVTIPLKSAALALCDSISPAAAAIGGVNTLIPLYEPQLKLRGENTDWLGFMWPLARALAARRATRSAASPSSTVICIGAGATAAALLYAVQVMNLKAVVFNPRTPARGEALAARFSHATSVSSLEDVVGVDIAAVVCTLPPAAAFVCPSHVMRTHTPIAFDVTYSTRSTPFLSAAAEHGCVTLHGLDMLIAQAAAAHAMWTGRLNAGSMHEADLYFPTHIGAAAARAEMARREGEVAAAAGVATAGR